MILIIDINANVLLPVDSKLHTFIWCAVVMQLTTEVEQCVHYIEKPKGQLRQHHLAKACDEGVYRIAREIMLLRPDKSENLKIYLGCIGKYLRGSGAENIWIENEIFGPNTTEAVCSRRHGLAF